MLLRKQPTHAHNTTAGRAPRRGALPQRARRRRGRAGLCRQPRRRRRQRAAGPGDQLDRRRGAGPRAGGRCSWLSAAPAAVICPERREPPRVCDTCHPAIYPSKGKATVCNIPYGRLQGFTQRGDQKLTRHHGSLEQQCSGCQRRAVQHAPAAPRRRPPGHFTMQVGALRPCHSPAERLAFEVASVPAGTCRGSVRRHGVHSPVRRRGLCCL